MGCLPTRRTSQQTRKSLQLSFFCLFLRKSPNRREASPGSADRDPRGGPGGGAEQQRDIRRQGAQGPADCRSADDRAGQRAGGRAEAGVGPAAARAPEQGAEGQAGGAGDGAAHQDEGHHRFVGIED